jgi:hypothetical protein
MRKLRIYVDNSVFGGVHDVEFADASRRFFAWVIAERHAVLMPDMTYFELAQAPLPVRQVLAGIPGDLVEDVSLDPEVLALARAYLDAEAVGSAHRVDAVQVAAASVARADIIVSWNFKHIVNLNRIRIYNAVNLLKGYGSIEIRTPREIPYEDEA